MWQSLIVCGLSDRGANKQGPELDTAGPLDPMSAQTLGARHGVTTPPPKAGLALNTSRTPAEMAAVKFCAQLNREFDDFLKGGSNQRLQFSPSQPAKPRGCGSQNPGCA